MQIIIGYKKQVEKISIERLMNRMRAKGAWTPKKTC